jgi:hypothetical protein
MNKITTLLIILIQIASCSFQSSQYNFVKEILNNNAANGPQKNWSVMWLNKTIKIYAINLDNQIIFADENINIFFKNKQIYKVTGLLQNNEIIEIDVTDQGLIYSLNNMVLRMDVCEEYISSSNSINTKISRICNNMVDGDYYKNEVILNNEGQIIQLLFKIHPNYAVLKLSKN